MARPRRDASKSGQSALAAAQKLRGRDPDNRIGSEVVNRIVSNSTQEFQNYLATAAGQNAMAMAAAAAPPPPVPFADPGTFAPPPVPTLMGNAAMERAFAVPGDISVQPPPFMEPAAVMPAANAVPPVPFADPTIPLPVLPGGAVPPPPVLGVSAENGMDPTMERLLRYFGLI